MIIDLRSRSPIDYAPDDDRERSNEFASRSRREDRDSYPWIGCIVLFTPVFYGGLYWFLGAQ